MKNVAQGGRGVDSECPALLCYCSLFLPSLFYSILSVTGTEVGTRGGNPNNQKSTVLPFKLLT